MQKPTIGRIVIYKTTAEDRDNLFRQGNPSSELPAIIVSIQGDDLVNLHVLPDSNLLPLWKTSIAKGDQEGNWNWPVIEEAESSAEVEENVAALKTEMDMKDNTFAEEALPSIPKQDDQQ